jgi:RNA polymerase primary sigma factor
MNNVNETILNEDKILEEYILAENEDALYNKETAVQDAEDITDNEMSYDKMMKYIAKSQRTGNLKDNSTLFQEYNDLIKNNAAPEDIKKKKEEILIRNLGLISTAIKQLGLSSVSRNDKADYMQEGTFGLITAIDKFDSTKNVQFSTYAMIWIKHHITRYIYNCKNSIRIPVCKRQHILKVNKTVREMEKEGWSTEAAYNDIDELKKRTGYSQQIIESAIEGMTMADNNASLDKSTSTDNEELSIASVIPSNINIEKDYVNSVYNEKIMSQLMSGLKVREIDVINLRFGFTGNGCETLESVGQKYGLSRERVRQIELTAIRKMKANAVKYHISRYEVDESLER